MRYEEVAALRAGIREICATERINRLDDELFALNERLGEGAYPNSAKGYLDDWAATDAGWLRPMNRPASH